MTRETSIYLDAVRFCAALAVFFEHIGSQRLSGGFLWNLHGLGTEGVTVFFVLSGYVIAHATATRETTGYTYAVNRAARLYSVVLPALAAMAVLDGFGFHLKPELYLAYPSFAEASLLLHYAVCLVFLNQWWAVGVSPGINLAYWSLGYEVWYYVIFGVYLFVPGRWRWPATVVVAIVAGPRILLLLPVWLMGVSAYHAGAATTCNRRMGWAMFLGSMLAWACYEWTVRAIGRPLVAPLPLLPRIEIPQDYIIASLFVTNLVGFTIIGHECGRLLARIGPAIRWMAGATFSLYVLHLPVAHFIVAVAPWPVEDVRTRACVIVGTLLLCFAFAEVTERRKAWYRQAVDAGLSFVLRRRFTPALRGS